MLRGACEKSKCLLVAQSCLTLCSPMDCSLPMGRVGCPSLLCPWDSPGKNTGVDSQQGSPVVGLIESNKN